MSIRSLSVLFSAALLFTVAGCSAKPAVDDVDVVITDGVNDDLTTPAVDATTPPKAANNDDDLDVVVEKNVE